MQITYVETGAITNEVLRAYAGAHPLCIGYPDGVPETWRDAGPGADRTRERLDELEYRLAVAFEHIEDLEESARRCAGETGGQ